MEVMTALSLQEHCKESGGQCKSRSIQQVPAIKGLKKILLLCYPYSWVHCAGSERQHSMVVKSVPSNPSSATHWLLIPGKLLTPSLPQCLPVKGGEHKSTYLAGLW